MDQVHVFQLFYLHLKYYRYSFNFNSHAYKTYIEHSDIIFVRVSLKRTFPPTTYNTSLVAIITLFAI